MEMINSLQQKSNNILTAWKFLLLFYPFTSNVNSLIALITIEKKWYIYQITVTNNKSKSTEDITYISFFISEISENCHVK